MSDFISKVNNIADIIEWDKNGQLELSPDFQRRSVWSENAKSYLIDTILKGKPMPKIFIAQRLEDTKNIRTVIDGQQRLRTILDFYRGDFTVKKIHNEVFAGKYFDSLPEDARKKFLGYNLSIDVLNDMSYADTLDIFARINSYTVILEKQELFNALYVGNFKQLAFGCGNKYAEFFLEAGVLTKDKIARMGEIVLSSDFLMNIIDGIQSANNIETYYKKYEDKELPKVDAEKIFDNVMTYISEIYPDSELSTTIWKKPALFYTLFIALAHTIRPIKGVRIQKAPKINSKNIGKIRIVLDDLSSKFKSYKNEEETPVSKDFETFFIHAKKGTTNANARIYRVQYLLKQIASKI